jgi:hypothetical protein
VAHSARQRRDHGPRASPLDRLAIAGVTIVGRVILTDTALTP